MVSDKEGREEPPRCRQARGVLLPGGGKLGQLPDEALHCHQVRAVVPQVSDQLSGNETLGCTRGGEFKAPRDIAVDEKRVQHWLALIVLHLHI